MNVSQSKLEALKKTAKTSSRYPFIAEHRGGPLKMQQHQQLIQWACKCITHVLPFFDGEIDERLEHAIQTANAWAEGNATVGDARNAAFGAINVANELTDPAQIAIARGIGHAVSTAHMADHAPGAAEYALKALAMKDLPTEEEHRWQDSQLPKEIKELVMSSRKSKSKFWNKHIQNSKK